MVISWITFIKKTIISIALTILLLVTYAFAAYIIAYIPVNTEFKECNTDGVEIYISTNGVHTDLVLPIQNNLKNWSAFVNPADTKLKNTNYQYVSFGWGDRGFYIETPSWDNLKFKTAFNALFFLSSTAMHVSFYASMNEDAHCKKICISKKNYTKLIDFIDNSFEKQNNLPVLIKGACYGYNDLFYNAKGTYSLFYTCNTWANQALKSAQVKACIWTLFDKGIFEKYN